MWNVFAARTCAAMLAMPALSGPSTLNAAVVDTAAATTAATTAATAAATAAEPQHDHFDNKNKILKIHGKKHTLGFMSISGMTYRHVPISIFVPSGNSYLVAGTALAKVSLYAVCGTLQCVSFKSRAIES